MCVGVSPVREPGCVCGGGHRRLRCIPRCASVRGCGMSRGGRGGIVVCLGGGGGALCHVLGCVRVSGVSPGAVGCGVSPGDVGLVAMVCSLGWWDRVCGLSPGSRRDCCGLCPGVWGRLWPVRGRGGTGHSRGVAGFVQERGVLGLWQHARSRCPALGQV